MKKPNPLSVPIRKEVRHTGSFLLAQNDLLCTLTLTRVSSNLAYAYVQCSGLPAREAYQKV